MVSLTRGALWSIQYGDDIHNVASDGQTKSEYIMERDKSQLSLLVMSPIEISQLAESSFPPSSHEPTVTLGHDQVSYQAHASVLLEAWMDNPLGLCACVLEQCSWAHAK